MDRVAGKPAVTDDSQELWNFLNLNLNHGAIMRQKLQGNLLHMRKLLGNLLHPEIEKIQGILELETGNGHIVSICLQQVVPHMGKVYSIVRKIYDRSSTDNLDDLDVNTALLDFFP